MKSGVKDSSVRSKLLSPRGDGNFPFLIKRIQFLLQFKTAIPARGRKLDKNTDEKADTVISSNFAHGKHPVCLDKSA